MRTFAIKRCGEYVLKLGTKSVPRFYATKAHANNAISQLADADRCKDRHECYQRLKRVNWDGEMYAFCDDAVPPKDYYIEENYELVEMNL